jgi:predicted HTH transcriptional regulator
VNPGDEFVDDRRIKKMIYTGEKIDVEFNCSRNDITKEVYDTVCSFNNRNGGWKRKGAVIICPISPHKIWV